MFNSLSDRLNDTFDRLRGKGKLTEADIAAAMREIRMALLEADVNYKVVKDFVSRTKERCLTAEVMESLTPAQNVVKIVLDELTELLGGTESKLVLSSRIPNVIMLVACRARARPPQRPSSPTLRYGELPSRAEYEQFCADINHKRWLAKTSVPSWVRSRAPLTR